MFTSFSIGILHQLTSWLLQPVIWALLGFVCLAIYEIGIVIAERFSGIPAQVKQGNIQHLMKTGRRRIERADFVSRISPMLGLMGTIIPLGPGLAALGSGEVKILTTAMTVAFDTTVIGLLTGMAGFIIGRLRRRWYDQALQTLEQPHG